MSSWFDKYMRFNLTGRLVMVASVGMSWRTAEWFMNLESPSAAQASFVSVVMGIMSALYGLYLGKEAKGKS